MEKTLLIILIFNLLGVALLLENKLDPGTNNNQTNTFSIQFLDSPSSTSALTYKIQIKNDGGNYVNINRMAQYYVRVIV